MVSIFFNSEIVDRCRLKDFVEIYIAFFRAYFCFCDKSLFSTTVSKRVRLQCWYFKKIEVMKNN